MQRLLIAVDADSAQRTQSAVNEAITRSWRGPLRVHVLSVQPPVSGHVAMFFAEGEILRMQEETGAQELRAALAALQQAGVACAGHVRVGRRAETIADLAREQSCDTILMGQDPHPGPMGRLFGSVAQQVRQLLGESAGNFRVIGS